MLGALAAGVVVVGGSTAAGATGVRDLDEVFTGVTATHDLVYGHAVDVGGHAVDLGLDLYQPTGDTELRRPVFIWAHGGFFTRGDKSEIGSIAPFLVKRGWVVLSIDYRLDPSLPEGLAGYESTPQLPYDLARLVEEIRDAQHDLQAAIRWARANAATFRLDPDRIATGGFSAGATMSVAAAYNSDDPGDSGNPGFSSRPTAAIGTGTLNVPLVDIHPDPLVEPPVAMYHGALDQSPYLAPVATCAVATAMLDVCETHLYQGQGHSSTNGLPDWPAFLSTWVVQRTPPPVSLPPGLLPTLPAVRVPSALVPKDLLPGPL